MTTMSHLPTMRWDHDDQLQETSRNPKNESGRSTFYVYDSSGERIRKVTVHSDGAPKHERIYLGVYEIYREYEQTASKDADKPNSLEVKLERTSLHIGDDQGRVALIEHRTNGDNGPKHLIRFQLNNHLNSSSTELSETADIISHEEYFPFGDTSYQAVTSDLESNPGRYRYSGKERDEENGFSHHGARYYATAICRWTSADPLGIVDHANLFVYVRNNPVIATDPSGLVSKPVVAGAVSAAVTAYSYREATKEGIPSSPLFSLGWSALGSDKAFSRLQGTINDLNSKALAKKAFSSEEETFLVELFKSYAIGGRLLNMPEAADLAEHYVSGNGSALQISATPYKKSAVVQDATDALQKYIQSQAKKGRPFGTISTASKGFRNSEYFKPLMKVNGSRDDATQGYVKSSGTVFAEQNNHRLQKADNRFLISAKTKQLKDGRFKTTYRVDNVYDFEPYSKGSKYTDLPLRLPSKLSWINSDVKTLRLTDGLSEYMDTGLGIAKPFKYHAEWSKTWN